MLIQQPEKLNTACLDVMNFLNEVTLWYPSAISFAPGRPAEQFFDVRHGLDKITSYVAYAAKNSGQSPEAVFNQLGQYQKTNGIINDLVCRFLERDEGIHTTADAIMITDGCQEAMTILLAGLFNPAKDVLLVIDPTYTGITGIASVLGTELYSVPSEKDDIDLDALAISIHQIQAQGKNPRALYVTPDFNNPLGTSMTLEDRKRLLDLARASGILIIEDNAYGMFAYDSEHMPTLKALDTDGVVVYLGTFSKLLFPALRVGFLVADQRVLHDDSAEICCLAEELSKVKSFTTVSTSALLQAIVGGILLEAECSLHETIQDKIAFYRTNRDLMLKYLEQHFGRDPLLAEKVSWNHPHGGFFLSVNLPFAFTKDAMRTCAENYGVICCPMSFFSLLGRCEKQVRLSFSYVSPHEIERGVLQFWKFVHNYAIMGQ